MPTRHRTMLALAAAALLTASCCLHLPREDHHHLATATHLQLRETAGEVDSLIDHLLEITSGQDESLTPEAIEAERARLRRISGKIREASDAVELLWILEAGEEQR